MKFILRNKCLWGIVEGREVHLVIKGVEKEQMKYNERTQKALTIIFLNLSSELKSVMGENPKDTWEALKPHLLPDSKGAHFSLHH